MGGRIESLYYSSPVWLQNMLVSALGYRLYVKRYTGRYHQIRALLSEARHWTGSQRLAYQNERLYEMVRFCKQNVPYYQKLFAEHGLASCQSVQRWQHRITPMWKKVAGGCHLNRPIPELLEQGGFHISEIQHQYMDKAPKIAGYVYWGQATAR